MLMVMFWTGWGFLVPVVGVATLMVAQTGIDSIWGEGYYKSHAWALQIGIASTGIAVSAVGWLINRKRGLLIDEDTGTTLYFHPKHTFFFIKMEYWGPIIFGLGALIFFGR